MTQWEVYLVVVSLLGFAIAICTPIIKLNTSIVRLIEQLKVLDKGLDELDEKNHKSHERIWKHNEDQDKMLDDHEKRIIRLEDKT